MSIVSTVKARGQFSDVINRVAYAKERIVLSRRGKNVAAVVPIDDLTLLEKIEEQIDLEDARKALAEPDSIPWDKVKKDLGL